MALFNPRRNPDKYPFLFHSALAHEGQHLIGYFESEAQAKVCRKKFNAFKATVRHHTLHKLHENEKKFSTLVRIRRALASDGSLIWEVHCLTQLSLLNTLEKYIDRSGAPR